MLTFGSMLTRFWRNDVSMVKQMVAVCLLQQHPQFELPHPQSCEVEGSFAMVESTGEAIDVFAILFAVGFLEDFAADKINVRYNKSDE
jgi:hypothetical protein